MALDLLWVLVGLVVFVVVLAGAAKRKDSLKDHAASKQMVIPAADHFFGDHEAAMVKAVKEYLDGVK